MSQQNACGRLRNARSQAEIQQILQSNRLKYAREYSCAIAACGRVKDADGALALIAEMYRQRIQPDLICYSAAVVACQKAVNWRSAIDLLNEMEQHGIRPDLVTFNSAMSACEKGQQWDLALELLSKMRLRGT
eukprot:973689-Prymnesium_polylepis.1